MSASVQAGTLETNIPSRLDRLPWSRFHWMVVLGLGTVWILDGIEVTIVGSVAQRLTEEGSGIALTPGQIGIAAAVYVAGACIGALFFGQLTDRFGRKRLFLITLAVYIAATVATAFAFAPWYFYLARFFTGAGIGGEYAAINSAIDELIPARVRGRVDLIINGSYWLGAAAGAAGAIILLNESFLAKDVGWRVAFGLGAVLGLAIMLVRRTVPESPRWLFIHGREEEAEEIVRSIERDVEEETGEELSEPRDTITVRQREKIPFRTIGATAWKLYPSRTVLAFSLFVGQAFIYNAFTFQPRGDPRRVLQGRSRLHPDLLHPLRARQPRRAARARPAFRHGRPPDHDLRHLSHLGRDRRRHGHPLQPGQAERLDLHGVRRRNLLLRVRRRERRLPDRERDLSDGDTRAGDRVLLRDRHGRRRHHRPAPLRADDRVGKPRPGDACLPDWFGRDGFRGIVAAFLAVRAEQKPLEEVAQPLTAAEAEEGDLEATGEGAKERRDQDAAADSDTVGTRQEADWERRHRERAERRATPLSRSRRYRPGPGSSLYSPGMFGTSLRTREPSETDLDREVDLIARTVETNGPTDRRNLARLVGARHWGPGRFRGALQEAVSEGRVRRTGRGTYAPTGSNRN